MTIKFSMIVNGTHKTDLGIFKIPKYIYIPDIFSKGLDLLRNYVKLDSYFLSINLNQVNLYLLV